MGVVGASGVHPHLQVIRPQGRVPTWPTWGGAWAGLGAGLGAEPVQLRAGRLRPAATAQLAWGQFDSLPVSVIHTCIHTIRYTHAYIQVGTHN